MRGEVVEWVGGRFDSEVGGRVGGGEEKDKGGEEE